MDNFKVGITAAGFPQPHDAHEDLNKVVSRVSIQKMVAAAVEAGWFIRASGGFPTVPVHQG